MMLHFSFLPLCLCYLQPGVFGVDTNEVKSVSVKMGESINLHTDEEIQTYSSIEWRFGGSRIARIKRVFQDSPQYEDERFTHRLKLDTQTGSLTIKSTNRTDEGVYKLTITTDIKESTRIFNLTVNAFSTTTTFTSQNPPSSASATDCNLRFDLLEAVIRLVVTVLMGVAALAAVVVLVYDIKTRREERINTTSFRD